MTRFVTIFIAFVRLLPVVAFATRLRVPVRTEDIESELELGVGTSFLIGGIESELALGVGVEDEDGEGLVVSTAGVLD